MQLFTSLFGGRQVQAPSQTQQQLTEQASRLFASAKDTASTWTTEITKKMNYTGDNVYFEADDKQDEDIRVMLASQFD